MAGISFYSWQREGIANAIQAVGASPRPKVELEVRIDNQSAKQKFQVVGPGDIIGFSTDMVIRTEPVHWNTNFPPNLLAYIEFYDEDFPWRYSPDPAKQVNTTQLNPWLALIVLKEDEFTPDSQNPIPLPRIILTKEAKLPPLSENHLWAHVQELPPIDANDANNPDRIISRLLCPRHLEPNTPYHAFVVPVYKNGQLAGLGKKEAEINESATKFTWEAVTPTTPATTIEGLQLPIYFQWYFHTGNNMDFESLADLLELRRLEPMVGRKKMDCSQPEFGISTNATRLTYLEGALKTVSTNHNLTTNLAGFEGEIKTMLNEGIKNNAEPVVTPPFYGQKHMGATKLEPTQKTWIHQLNLDPANRAAAGLGVQVLRKYQDYYMQKAWEQVESIVEANKIIETAASTLAISQSMYEKHFVPLMDKGNKSIPNGYVGMGLIAPIHVKTIAGSETFTFMEADKTQVTIEIRTLQNLLEKSPQNTSMYSVNFRRAIRKRGAFYKKLKHGRGPINFNELIIWKAEKPPLSLSDSDNKQFIDTPIIKSNIDSGEFIKKINTFPNKPNEPTVTWDEWKERIEPKFTIPALLGKMMTMPAAFGGLDTPEKIKPALAYPDFEDPMYLKLIELSTEFLMPNLHLIPNNTIALLESNQTFIEAFMVGLNMEMCREMRWREFPTDERGSCFRTFWDRKGLLTEAEKKAHTAQFKDITPIHTWKTPAGQPDTENGLGKHHNSTVTSNPLVLALRGDLFKCFPNASVYAIEAKKNNAGELVVDTVGGIKFPAFKAEVGADVKLLGFDLRKDDAIATEAGWFFIIQETPGETRFGMDINAPKAEKTTLDWDDISWTMFNNSDTFIKKGIKPNLSQGVKWLPSLKESWANSSADMASILYQKPVMIAIHASEILRG